MNNISMLASFWSVIADLISGIFAIVPQSMYFIYASAASVVDFLTFVIRKLVGLDVYYVDGQKQSGDILTYFIEGILGINQDYSVLSTVFWSMIIFGVILIVFATIIAIIKSHYDYDNKKLTAMQIINRMIKGLLTMVIIPVVTVFSLYLSEILLKTLDAITNGSNSSTFETVYESEGYNRLNYSTKDVEGKESKNRVYSSLDFFGFTEYSNMYSFSGAIFGVAGHNANRVRNGSYTAVVGESNSNWENMGIFYSESESQAREEIAVQIDTAFEYCLSVKNPQTITIKGDSFGLLTSYSGLSATFAVGLINVKTFSKFNVGLVWYYYNLWTFDWILAFGGITATVILLFNLVLGLIRRLFLLIVLFFVAPPIAAIYPLDEGNAVKNWRTNFLKTYLSSFSMVVALNIVLILLPFLKTIKFFNVGILDSIMTSLFAITGLVVVKKVIKMFSELIGAESIEEAGGKLAKEFGDVATKGVQAALKLMDLGVSAGKGGFNVAFDTTKAIKKGIKKNKIKKKLNLPKGAKLTLREYMDYEKATQIDKLLKKDNDRYSRIADERLQFKAKGMDKNSEEYKKLKDEEMRKVAEDESLYQAGRAVSLNDDFMKNNREAIDKYKKEREWLDVVAEYDMREKYGLSREELEDLKKSDPDKYNQMLEKEKDLHAARSVESDLYVQKFEKREEKKKKIQNAIVDIGGGFFKLAGDLTGISGLKEKFEKSGTTDLFKKQAQKYFQALGLNYAASSDKLKTADQKKQEEKEQEEKKRKAIKETAEEFNKSATESLIENLCANFQSYKTSVDTWNECYDLVRELYKKQGKQNVTAEQIKATVRKYKVDPMLIKKEINSLATKPDTAGTRKTKAELAKELLLAQGVEEKKITDQMIKETAAKYKKKEDILKEIQKLKK